MEQQDGDINCSSFAIITSSLLMVESSMIAAVIFIVNTCHCLGTHEHQPSRGGSCLS
jgi:hypothetical protein